MHPVAILQAMILLTLANGTPVIVAKLLGPRLAWPADGSARFLDGRRIFGPSKTIRGIAVAVAATSLGAPLIGVAMATGALAAVTAMAGDLFSSFVKRRLDRPSSSRALGLDQVPEALFPLLACAGALSLSVLDIALGVAIFFIGELIVSRLLYRLKLRDQPY